MRYNIKEEKFGKQSIIKLVDSETKEYVSILPETGGMLNSLELNFNGELIPVLEDYKTEKELQDTLENSFKGSNLFPFPNRIKDGQYSYEGKSYQLHITFPNENNAIHGLVYDKPFTVISKSADDNSASCLIEYNADGSTKGFPFIYQLQVYFELSSKSGLTVTTTVKNTGKQNMPAGNGWHPYFKLKSKVDELLFQFPSISSFEADKQMIPTGKSEQFDKFNKLNQIKQDFFDTCFSLSTTDKNAKVRLHDPLLENGLELWQETGENKFNFLQIYTPDHRNNIALEPMTCMPDALNNKKGLIDLKPNDKLSFSWGVKKIK